MNVLHPKLLIAAAVATSLAMAGCSSTPKSSDASTVSTAADSASSAEMSSLQGKVTDLESQLANERAKLQQMQGSAATSSMAATGSGELLPPNAKPGECYARIFIPPSYNTATEQVLKSEASEKISVIPAKFEWVQEQVVVREASQRLEVVPATFDWVEEIVTVKSASKRVEVVPASYKTVTEKILDKPEHTVWKKGTGPISKIDESTGEIMCLVTIPATYKTLSKRVLVNKGGTREIDIPGETKIVKKKVMKTPPTTRSIEIPAKYKTVKVRKMVEPPKTTATPIPAKYSTVTKRTKVSEGYIEWRPVLCKTNTTADVVRRIQSALSKAGHNPGPLDGALGGQTLAAVKSYQKAKGLPTGGITMKTLTSLGVTP